MCRTAARWLCSDSAGRLGGRRCGACPRSRLPRRSWHYAAWLQTGPQRGFVSDHRGVLAWVRREQGVQTRASQDREVGAWQQSGIEGTDLATINTKPGFVLE